MALCDLFALEKVKTMLSGANMIWCLIRTKRSCSEVRTKISTNIWKIMTRECKACFDNPMQYLVARTVRNLFGLSHMLKLLSAKNTDAVKRMYMGATRTAHDIT